jgi:transposase
MVKLEEASRGELLVLIAQQQQLIGALRETVARLEARVQELEQRLGPGGPHGMPGLKPAAAKPARAKRPRKQRRQNFARRRATPTEQVVHALAGCPRCGKALVGGWVKWRREVLDLPMAPATVTEHLVLARRCPGCRCVVTPRLDLSDQVLGQHRVGLRLMGVIAFLREHLRLPLALIQRYLADLHGLHLSEGELVAVLRTVADRSQQAVAAIRDAVRHSPVVHADETGWREDGHNGYLWGFSTPQLRYFICGNRSKAMVDTVLGQDFAGVLVTDFYAAYDHYPGPHQRCWVHVLRDIHDLKRLHPTDRGLARWGMRVSALYQRAKASPGPPGSWSPHHQQEWRRQHQRAAEQALAHICQPFAGQAVPQRVLCQRLLKYLPELFTFLADPRVPADNNAAERSLRPSVVRRKISGGTRSAAGTLTRTCLWTLTETWNLQRKPILDAWTALLRNPAAAAPSI